jgi:hypothetical protein
MDLVDIKYVYKNKRLEAYSFCSVCGVWKLCRTMNKHRLKCVVKNNEAGKHHPVPEQTKKVESNV